VRLRFLSFSEFLSLCLHRTVGRDGGRPNDRRAGGGFGTRGNAPPSRDEGGGGSWRK
jgi:hypothetical protein